MSSKRSHMVVVGNIGTVYTGTNGFHANVEYNTYVGKSKRGEGRASGESVTHFIDDEIHKEHIGKYTLEWDAVELDEEEYAEKAGVCCPVCESDQIEGASVDISKGEAAQEMVCSNCNSSWTDVYKLTGYRDLVKCG